MQKCFFLICPTDCLEQTINKSFTYVNYFYSSLGNSFVYDRETIGHLGEIIEKHQIKKIYFVLSIDNKIVEDALNNKSNHNFSNTRALNNFNIEITKQKEQSKIVSREGNLQFSLLSYFLNNKIKELEIQLSNVLNESVKIGGKIYDRELDAFTTIYADLICLEKYHLN
jgi:hypothetical protein